MRFKGSKWVGGLAVAAILSISVKSAPGGSHSAPSPYTVFNLGTLGGTFSEANGINNEGLVAGISTTTGDESLHAAAWFLGIRIDVGTLGGPNSFANLAPNDLGQIAGGSDTLTPDPLGADFCGFGTQLICRPFVWQVGRKTALPTLGGNSGYAQALNNRGQIIGQVENKTPDPSCSPVGELERRAVLWSPGRHAVEELRPLSGDPDALPLAINDAGVAAGASGNCATVNVHAVIWKGNTASDLGNLGSEANNAALDINNFGDIAGQSSPTDSNLHATLWRGGTISDLGALPGEDFSLAIGINDRKQVVGESCDPDFNCDAFLWQNGTMTDLNSLIPADSTLFLISATYINASGEIVGFAFDEVANEGVAFLAIPRFGGSPKPAATPQTRSLEASTRHVQLPESMRKMLRARALNPSKRRTR